MGHAMTLMMILFCINFSLYLVGYQSSAQIMFNLGTCPATTGNITQPAGVASPIDCAQAGQNIVWILMAAIGAAILVPIGLSTVTSSFSVLYTIPLAIGAIVAALLLTPLSFVYAVGMPAVVRDLILGVFAMLIIGIIIEFVRGGSF